MNEVVQTYPIRLILNTVNGNLMIMFEVPEGKAITRYLDIPSDLNLITFTDGPSEIFFHYNHLAHNDKRFTIAEVRISRTYQNHNGDAKLFGKQYP
jgi:hypothetical protein